MKKSKHGRRTLYPLLLALFGAAAVLIWSTGAREMIIPRVAAAAFVVTTTSDSGNGSLRSAIASANINSGPDKITFNIPPTDPRHFYYQDNSVTGTVSQSMIAVTAAADDTQIAGIDPDWPHSWFSIQVLPVTELIQGEVSINGYSQPGAIANTNVSGGLNSVLKIEIDGRLIGGSRSVENVFEPAEYRGLIVNGFDQTCGIGSLSSTGNVIAGNYIGTDPSGTIPLGNAQGVCQATGQGTSIGGNTPADRNLLSGNRTFGISIVPSSFGHQIIGNLIGTARDGVSPLPNGVFSPSNIQAGMRITTAPSSGSATNHQILKNVIAFNGLHGIVIGAASGVGGSLIRNRISQNSIHSNGGIGINSVVEDVNFVNLNDVCDADSGDPLANNGMNHPVLTSGSASGGNITILGTLDGGTSGTFTIEFFANPTADSSTYGEGKTYLGSTTVNEIDGVCGLSFSATFPRPAGAGDFITATATDADGNTSEFAQNISIASCASITLNDVGSDVANTHVPYSRSVTASGGTGSYTYALTGTLPTGLTLDPDTGEISGIPSGPPDTQFDFSVTATDTSGCSGQINLSITLEPFSSASFLWTRWGL